MKLSLPPFPALETFLAVARTGGVRKAARSLNVTDSAVSHQLRKLEEYLGTPVMERHGRGVRLTPIGRRYAEALDEPLSEIAQVTDRLFGTRSADAVTLTTVPVVATLSLIPRIKQLEADHPELMLRLVTTTKQLDLNGNDIDLALRYVRGPADPNELLTFDEYAFPVCAPALAEGRAQDIRGQRRLLNNAHTEDWSFWTRQAGTVQLSDEPTMSFDSSEMTLGAAIQGMGVAIGRTPLVNAFLKSGQLVAPFGTGTRGEGHYRIIHSSHRRNISNRDAVTQWLSNLLGPLH
ncbi:LysR family transcriptional regulator [Halomonas elongata]|uniref:LysR family transcription regulator n=1 Tax=Halomonas elongata (strain ATCC 33173 / DSM 2581 / NBRC 15536 / NCIMB 2198 / 1H9) TaxID=768066 RepID=A0A1R4A4E4_HALED|nr:LysR family transcriptional regulator [Halomonas elongata]WBF16570.1 LysR family transcriptional regulator [Halomonas elongata]WPU49011.1 LysR family transcriptional regulator [Halomonas elongata DSM 2581]SJK83828.1 LysR family transcription regulator [Halomonas elongata DSM 2581]